ncbi:MAG: hypothetical protein QOF76_1631 [Solirubrobacteraceae bacterium]|nr:hypothetical protein [Solirubrobacteraceae bacterium]
MMSGRWHPERKTLRALELRPGGTFRWRAVAPLRAPKPLAAVVRPIAVATCDMDRPIALGATPFPAPLCFGHECVAEVLAVGSKVRTVRAGDRVVVPFQISCGACPKCGAGHTGNCTRVPPISMYGFGLAGGHWGGAIADELAVPFADGMLVPLPTGIDPVAAASVSDNVSDAWRHIGPHVQRDSRVLILSAMRDHLFTASVPLYAGLIAQAAALGIAAVTRSGARKLDPVELVMDSTTTGAGLRFAMTKVAPDGVCSSVGSLHKTAKLPFSAIYGRNATLHIGRAHARAVIPHVLELMTSGRLRPERVTTVVAPMDDAVKAMTEHARGGTTKTILTAS